MTRQIQEELGMSQRLYRVKEGERKQSVALRTPAECSESRLPFVRTELFHRVMAWFRHGCFPSILVIVGPAGIGKTYTVRHIAHELSDIPFFFLPATWRQSLENLMGYWELRDGQTQFTQGDLLKGLSTEGACICIDDAHCLSQDLQLLNGVGDISREVVCAALGRRVPVAPSVKLILLANPIPASGIAPWEAQKWEIPIQIRDRSLMIELSESLSVDDERAILSEHWPEGHPTEVMDGLLEVCRNLRANQVLQSFAPSIRSLIITASELRHGASLSAAFEYGISNKYTDRSERAAAIEAFDAKFDPETGSSTSDDNKTQKE